MGQVGPARLWLSRNIDRCWSVISAPRVAQPNADVQPQLDARANGFSAGAAVAASTCYSSEAACTVTSNWSLTSLSSSSFAVTVIVAVPVDIPTTVSVE